MTAYRNDVDALAARADVLARELADKERERADVEQMLAEARAAEAAAAIQHDVMSGRRSLRRAALGLAVLTAVGGAAGTLLITHENTRSSMPDCIINVRAVPVETWLATKGLTEIELEPRFVGSAKGFASAAELHEAIGDQVAPWETFTFIHDASPRQAVASELQRGGDDIDVATFATDGQGGVWRVVLAPILRDPALHSRRVPATVGVTRQIWLLPQGSTFRGDVEVAYPR